MVRIVLVAGCALAVLTNAYAQERTVAEQHQSAVEIFMGGEADTESYFLNYREHILAGIAGRWLQTLPDVEATPELCERLAFEVAVQSEYAFLMRRSAKEPALTVDYTYVSMGGNMFGEQVDPEQHMRWLGLDKMADNDAMAPSRISALSSVNGIATIFRPSPDILVIQTNYRPPRLFVRCR